MDTTILISTVALLATALYWFVCIFRSSQQNRRCAGNLSFGSIHREQVHDKFNQYLSFFHHPKQLTEMAETVPAFVDIFYDLVTDMYEHLWGQSFHFSPSIPGKSNLESTRIHEQMAVDLIDVKPGQKILDAGCGVGGPMRAIAAHSGCNVVGITINEYQVSREKILNEKAGLDKHCQVICGNFLQIPFENESFDGAYSIEATCHAPKLDDVYSEIFRVLKPGSMYVSYEWVTTELYQGEDPKHVEIIHGIERGDALPGLRSYSDVAEVAKKVGFEVVKEKDLAKAPAKPWWRRLKKGRIAYWKKRIVIMLLEKLGIVPKGTVAVHEMLFETMKYLVKGAEAGIFTPMHLILCRKPVKPQEA